MTTQTRTITKEEAAKLHEGLIPPTKDQQARNAEALAEAAESLEGGTINLEDIEKDDEIQYHLQHNELDITRKQPGRVYKWVYTGQQGRFVMQAKQAGWQVVEGQDPEAIELKFVDGTRRLADVMLMWITEKQYNKNTAWQLQMNRRQQEGVVANLIEQADRYGVIVHQDGNSPTMNAVMKRAGQRQVASGAVTGMLKSGTVPGLQAHR